MLVQLPSVKAVILMEILGRKTAKVDQLKARSTVSASNVAMLTFPMAANNMIGVTKCKVSGVCQLLIIALQARTTVTLFALVDVTWIP